MLEAWTNYIIIISENTLTTDYIFVAQCSRAIHTHKTIEINSWAGSTECRWDVLESLIGLVEPFYQPPPHDSYWFYMSLWLLVYPISVHIILSTILTSPWFKRYSNTFYELGLLLDCKATGTQSSTKSYTIHTMSIVLRLLRKKVIIFMSKMKKLLFKYCIVQIIALF